MILKLLIFIVLFTTNCFANSLDIDGNINFSFTAPRQVYLSPKPIIGFDGYTWIRPGFNFNNTFLTKATLNFKIETNYNTSNTLAPILDEAFVAIKSDFGKLEFGNFLAVNQQLKQNPAKIARGAGGINGKYLEYINLPQLKHNNINLKIPNFIVLSQSPIGHNGSRNFYQTTQRGLKDNSFDGSEDATKISYFLPKYQNHQFAMSYTFNSQKNGFTQIANKNHNSLTLRQIISIAWLYEQDFDNINLKLSTTTEQGKINKKQANLHNLNSYDFGAIVSYFGIKLATSYGFWGKSLQAKNGIYACDYQNNLSLAQQKCANTYPAKFGNSYYHSYGIAYGLGPLGASITNFNSNLQNNRYTATSLGLDYKIKKNLLSYIEFTNFKFKINQTKASDIVNQNNVSNSLRQISNNQGLVMITGIYFNF